MNLGELYDFLRYVSNKEQMGDSISPSAYNTMLKAANLDLFKRMYDIPERYQVGMPISKISFELTQKLIDSTSTFKETKEILTDSSGKAPYPSDYIHMTAVLSKRYERSSDCEFVVYSGSTEGLKENQIADRISNSITIPTRRDACYVLNSDNIQFYPEEKGMYTIRYIRLPKTPEFGYDIIDDEIVYNPATSTEIEWGEEMHLDIARQCLVYMGKNLSDQALLQYSEQHNETGV
jgi:hypothetical protein